MQLNNTRSRMVGFAGLATIAVVVGIFALVATLTGTADAAGEDKNISRSSVYKFEDGSAVASSSASLTRSKNAISASLDTGELSEDGTTYTLWWVIFNNPQECENGVPGLTTCGENDLLVFGGKPEINSSALFAAGNVIGNTGLLNFGSHLEEGELPGGDGQVVWGPGLIDSKKAEVHLVVRSHGPVQAGIEVEQITTFGGGCTSETDPTGIGPIGNFECFDQQFAAFVPQHIK